MPPTLEKGPSKEDEVGLAKVPSHGIAIDVPNQGEKGRPPNLRHMSSPAYDSPLRHHRRNFSSPRTVKETLHARSQYTNSQDDGAAIHRINQYEIKQELGRGSFGAVHLAIDQYGNEYAVKEFSKSRLRKRAQSNLLRRPHAARRPGHLAAGLGFNSPLHRHSSSDLQDQEGDSNPLYLIKEEIAIMKKLNHDNLVSLIEVLDDPTEDSLYMVLEYCKKGVIMKVGVDECADPYDEEACRCWFRDLILGIEYLHAQGVVHRDIKPDNLLLTEDDVLKIVDFGVSEMFEKESEMLTAKSAGSPAFLPPELCVARHGGISGKAADIWSMGVTLYCLRFGCIPFERAGVLDLYESIKHDELDVASKECSDDLRDLISKILEKDPKKRIKMAEIREHPWVTRGGKDALLPEEENTANLIEPPTEEETNQAITGNLSNILVLMKAVKKFKQKIAHKRPSRIDGILGRDARLVAPPLTIDTYQKSSVHKSRSVDTHDRRNLEQALVSEGVHRGIDVNFEDSPPDRSDAAVTFSPATPSKRKSSNQASSSDHNPASPTSLRRALNARPQEHRALPNAQTWPIAKPNDHGKGHAHDPLEDHRFVGIGTGADYQPSDPPVVSESPPAAEMSIYEKAYREQVEHIRAKQGHSATLFLTRRVDKAPEFLEDQNLIRSQTENTDSGPRSGFAKLVNMARQRKEEKG